MVSNIKLENSLNLTIQCLVFSKVAAIRHHKFNPRKFVVPNWGYSAPHRNFQEGDVVPNSLNMAPHKIFMEGVVVPNSFDLAPHKCLRGDYNPLLTPNPFRGVGLVFLNECGR